MEIYKLDKNTGDIFTEAEFFNDRWFISFDDKEIKRMWESLDIIEIPEGKLEETREKMSYIYGSRSVSGWDEDMGTLFVKDPTKILKINVRHSY